MTYIQERGSTHVYHVNRMSKEEMDHMISLCVHEQPAYCVAACPFKADTKEMLFYAAKGNFKKALAIYEKITPFPMILCNGCTAPCEEKCRLCELGDGISIREVERAIVRYGEPGKRSSVFRIRKKKKAVIFGSGLFPLFLVGELEKKMYPATIYCQEKDYEAYIAAAAPELLESDRKNEVKRLSSMDLSFEFGCSLDLPFIRAKMKEADVVCASEEVAKKAGSRGNSRRRDHAERTGGNCQRSGPVCDGCSFCCKESCPDCRPPCTESFAPQQQRQ